MLLEDAMDLAGILEGTGRTIPRDRWADEAIEHAAGRRAAQSLEGLF